MAERSTSGDDEELLTQKSEFFKTYFRRGNEFIEELLRENEKLRFRLAQLEEQVASANRAVPTQATLKELIEKIHALELEKQQLLERFTKVEADNQEYHSRYEQIERENDVLANLYVAAYQLHSSLDLDKVVKTVVEILLNFIGAKRFAVLFLDDEMRTLKPVITEGMKHDVEAVPVGQGIMGAVAATGEAYIGAVSGSQVSDQPMIAVPISNRDSTLGVIAIWELLPHKPALVEVDHELFKLLGNHTASALEAAQIAASAAKLSPLRFSVIETLLHRS